MWFSFACNLIVIGLLCYGVYWLGITSGFAMAGIVIGGITFLVAAGTLGYGVFRTLRDPDWKPETPPFQIDSETYSALTNATKILVGSPLNLPLALLRSLHGARKRKSESDKSA
jgi:high-affinity Fe2+/Pb2+ permease